jgi:hypothetical protein
MNDLEAQKQKELIDLLLAERDKSYQQTARLKEQLSDKTDVASLKADHEKQLAGYEEQLNAKDEIIRLQQSKIEALLRRIWGKTSEKYIQPDPLQRKIDFGGEELLPEEKQAAEEAQEETTRFGERRRKKQTQKKQKPVRQTLPEDLPRVEKHLYPQEIEANKENWTELEPEITEVLVMPEPVC